MFRIAGEVSYDDRQMFSRQLLFEYVFYHHSNIAGMILGLVACLNPISSWEVV
jgi:hypothetical protein